MNSHKSKDAEQQSLDALLGQPQFYSNFENNGGFHPGNGVEHNSHQQPYSANTPAQQHEKLLYMNNKVNVLPDENSSSYSAMKHTALKTSTSFLDDKYSSSELEQESLANDPARGSISDAHYFGNNNVNSGSSFHEGSVGLQQPQPQPQDLSAPDFLFRQGDDAMFNFAEELSSSLGSSINSDTLASSYSSSFSFQPQPLSGSLAAQSFSHFSPNIRSPSSSLRAGSYLSSSLRNGGVGTPGMVSTPRTKFDSLGNAEGLLSASVPKTVSHLSTEERLRRKREFHNAVERRRRELIKQKIKELGAIVPPSLLNYDTNGKQIKPNKGIILNKTVEYLEYLMQVLEEQDRKKKQLSMKIQELQEKEAHLDSKIPKNQEDSRENQSSVQVQMHTQPQLQPQQQPVPQQRLEPQSVDYEQIDTDVSQERIIDTRAKPQPLSSSTTAANAHQWGETAIYNSSTLANNLLNNDDDFTSMNDDLQQFLSGDLIEAEDNAKLMFNSGDSNPADYLLEFDS